jgi:predicted amidohydrolase
MQPHGPAIRIAMAQFDFPVGDVAGNTERIIAMIGQRATNTAPTW